MNRSTRPRALVVLLVLAVCWLIGCPPAQAAPEADPTGEITPVYLLMDTSDSMSTDNGNGTRIEAAQEAALSVVDALDDNQKFALYAYPGGGRKIEGCDTARRVLGLSDTSKQEAAVQIRGMSPEGDTPTGAALEDLLDQIVKRDQQSRALVVLVSDGEENCTTRAACDVAKKYADSGIALTVNTVGLDNTDEGNAQLQCVADAAHGKFFPATDTDLGDRLLEATKPQIGLTVDFPAQLSVVTGGSHGGQARVTIEASGSGAASDVRVYLEVRRGGQAGSVLVPRPIRYLGNLTADRPAETIAFEIRPEDGDVGPVEWLVTATWGGKATVSKTGTSNVSGDLAGSTAGPLFATARNVVVLGDSYSSGEGAGAYDVSSTTATSNCHRSARGYGSLLFPNAKVIACSGSESKHLRESRTTVQIAGNGNRTEYLVEPQLVALRQLVDSGAPPDLVMMTMGGNDLGFADIATACAVTKYCIGWFDAKLSKFDIDQAFRNTMGQAYRDVDSVINSPEAIAKRSGKTADIVILPYVQLLPDVYLKANGDQYDFVGTSGCFLGFSATEAWLLNQFQTQLNQTLSAQVAQLQAQGRPFHYAGPVVRAFQPNHTLCEESGSYGVFQKANGDTNKTEDQERLHPNAAGHEAIARTLMDWSRQTGVTPMAAAGPAPHVSLGLGDWTGFIPNTQVALFEPGRSVRLCKILPGGCSRFLGGSVALVIIQSQPYIGATLIADDQGRIDGRVDLPDRLPAGRHHITVVGLDENGEPVSHSAEIRVWPAGSNVALLITGFGLILLVVALVAWRRESGRRRRQSV